MEVEQIKESAERHNSIMLALYRHRQGVYRILRNRFGYSRRRTGSDILLALAEVSEVEPAVAKACRSAAERATLIAEVEKMFTEENRSAMAYAERALMTSDSLEKAINNLSDMRKQVKENSGLTIGLDLAIEIARSGEKTIYNSEFMVKFLNEGQNGKEEFAPEGRGFIEDVFAQANADLEGAIYGAVAGAQSASIFGIASWIGAAAVGESFALLGSAEVAWRNMAKFGNIRVIHGPNDPNGPIYWPPVDPDDRPIT